jgi:hypothetical protein
MCRPRKDSRPCLSRSGLVQRAHGRPLDGLFLLRGPARLSCIIAVSHSHTLTHTVDGPRYSLVPTETDRSLGAAPCRLAALLSRPIRDIDNGTGSPAWLQTCLVPGHGMDAVCGRTSTQDVQRARPGQPAYLNPKPQSCRVEPISMQCRSGRVLEPNCVVRVSIPWLVSVRTERERDEDASHRSGQLTC